MKRALTALLAMVMVMALLAGCSSDGSQSSSAGPASQVGSSSQVADSSESASTPAATEPFTIGIFGFAAADAAKMPRYNNAIAFIEANGGSYVNVEVENNDYVSATETLINAGVDGIIYPATSESNLAVFINMCEAAKVYFVCADTDIPVEGEIGGLIENSQYYLGCLGKSEVQNSYDCASMLGQAEVEGIGLMALPAALTIAVQRDEGSQKAFEEYGVEVLSEVRDFNQYLTTAGGANVAQSFMAAFPELDGIFIAGATQYCLSGVVQAIKDAQRDVKVACIDYDENILQHMQDGIVVGFTGGNWNDDVMASALIINAIQGNRLAEDTVNFTTRYFVVDSVEACEQFVQAWDNGDCMIYTEAQMKDMLVSNNPAFTFEELMTINDSYSIESILANQA